MQNHLTQMSSLGHVHINMGIGLLSNIILGLFDKSRNVVKYLYNQLSNTTGNTKLLLYVSLKTHGFYLWVCLQLDHAVDGRTYNI
jgi:hypothetical protein